MIRMGKTICHTWVKLSKLFSAGFGYGDLIQPGLLQLQPLLEDEFMELEPIPGKQYNQVNR